VWNGLLRLFPWVRSDTFYSILKTVLFSCARIGSTSE